MRINVKSQILNGYNFQNNGFCKKIQTVLKSALKNTSLKKKFEIREGRGKCICPFIFFLTHLKTTRNFLLFDIIDRALKQLKKSSLDFTFAKEYNNSISDIFTVTAL